jgi:GTP cyclohydrolase IA
MTIDIARAEEAIRSFLFALGYDPDQQEDLKQTPANVVDAWTNELVSGHRVDVARLIAKGSVFQDGPSDLVMVRGLSVVTMCPHHLLPAEGYATVAYLPGQKLLGLGTMAHLVDALSRRLTLHERIGADVVEALMTQAGARGALCHLRLQHACLRTRGARASHAVVETINTAGELAGDGPSARTALALLGRGES